MATDPGRPFWSKAGTGPTFPNPVVAEYTSGVGYDTTETILAPHNNERASRLPDREPVKTAFHRSATMEGDGARLTVSPSMKMPTVDKQATLAGSTKVVRSTSRAGAFAGGQDVGY